MILSMIVEQTIKYAKRMVYDPKSNLFYESDKDSLFYRRNFKYPYGWIMESGTPPEPHWDVILMTDNEYNLGDEVKIKIIGIFKRSNGDHKFIAVEENRDVDDYRKLSNNEIDALTKLFPNVYEGEGWFGKDIAIETYDNCEKAL